MAGVIILVDRDERGSGELSAVREAERELDISVTSIVNINDIISYLTQENSSGFRLEGELLDRVRAYRAEFGAS